ncbi:MAG TPA: glycosyltransferase family 2 protein [Solirubrobacterales bacterium]|nr:glycosyltransferase family 2 protein [Solirubrobacterales bacterium]
MTRDLSVVVVSHNARPFLPSALRSLREHLGRLSYEVVVVDNGTDGAAELVRDEFPEARVLTCPNRGFAHGNNVALRTVQSRYVLLLNPDTEMLDGTLGYLIRLLDARPHVGVASVNQVMSNGRRWPTIKRYPSPLRTLAEALGATRLPLGGVLGERELRSEAYARETSCDWVAGSFMLVRSEAIESVGWFDERFFLYSEETDFCLRIKQAGWDIRHLPVMTVLHHETAEVPDARVEAQNVFARLQYGAKHFSRVGRLLFRGALLVRYGLRAAIHTVLAGRRSDRRAAAVAGLRVALGGSGSPYVEPRPRRSRTAARGPRRRGRLPDAEA